MTPESSVAEGGGPSYRTYLALSDQEKEHYPTPFLTVRWWDDAEIDALASQSWFSRLRVGLNRGGKVSTNIGIWKYEQSGAPRDIGSAERLASVRALFTNTAPVSVRNAHMRLVETTREAVFDPSFVMIDGELHMALATESVLPLMLRDVADAFGLEATARPSAVLPSSSVMDRSLNAVNQLFNEVVRDPNNRVESWRRNPGNLMKMRHRGKEYLQTFLLGAEGQVQFVVAYPSEALAHFVEPSGFGVRVLGWLEHGRPAQFFVRAIATATVDLVRFHEPN